MNFNIIKIKRPGEPYEGQPVSAEITKLQSKIERLERERINTRNRAEEED